MESPAQGEPRPEIRVAPGQILRLLFTPPRAGRRRGRGWGGPLGSPAPGALCSARLGWAALTPVKGGARSLPGGKTTRRRHSGRQPCLAASLASPGPPRPPGNLPRGFTRVHTCMVTARGSPGVPRVSPGQRGSPELRPPLAWDSPAPRLCSPRAGCDFTRVPAERGARRLETAARPGSWNSPPGTPQLLLEPLPRPI